MKVNKRVLVSALCGLCCAACVGLYLVGVKGEADAARAEALARYGGDQIEVCVASRDIAAGEVVNRPASVVKEIMENSIYAGATRVQVNFRDGGSDLIQIVDDGCGMSPIDARMAFDRHATSKIAAVEDIYALSTFGFRGEALASIAAVAQVELITKTREAGVGISYCIEGGVEKKLEETKTKMSLDDLFSQIKEGDLKELNLVVKADVQGSVEAVKQSLLKLSNEEVIVKCIHGGVGAINESDVTLASASNAIIIGFNVKPDAQAKATAEREKVDVRLYDVIYKAIEDVERAMKGMLAPIYEEKVIGHAEVRQIFKASAVGNIAGSYVLDGEFKRDSKIRITREGEQIYEGQLASLKRFKDDVKEVRAGYECGLVFEGFDQMKELDIVEAYIMVEVPRE